MCYPLSVMKKMFFVFGFLFVGAGCVPVAVEPPVSTSADDSALWIVSEVTSKEIRYVLVEWLTGNEAVQAARADGVECGENQACLPSGYYLRYPNGREDIGTWILGDTSSIAVQLICNTESCTPDNPLESNYKTMTFAKYTQVDQLCRNNPFECPYYSIGTEAFFDVQFSEDGMLASMIQRYVP